MGRKAALLQHVPHERDRVVALELGGCKIHSHHRTVVTSGPRGGFGDRFAEHQLAHLDDESGFFGDLDEAAGGEHAFGRVVPADQCFGPEHAPIDGRDSGW